MKDSADFKREYVGAFDGFRAVAATLVFLWHYVAFPYGWIGVDLFFVLSGFLITGILCDTRDVEASLNKFYIRRSLRIIPLYYAVIAVIFLYASRAHGAGSVFSTMVLWPLYLGNYAKAIVPHTDVQGIAGITLGHFWTLCIEEQFYLIWPAVVMLIRSRKTLLRVCVAVCVILPFARLLALSSWPYAVETDLLLRGTPFRCDALLAGAIGALLVRAPDLSSITRRGDAIALSAFAGLACVAVYSFYFAGVRTTVAQQPWMLSFGLSAVDLLGLGVILSCLDSRSWVSKVLSAPPLRELGKVSYGFYVFHLLPYALLPAIQHRFFELGLPSGWTRSVAVALCFWMIYCVSVVSFRLFERPILALKDRLAPYEGKEGRGSLETPACKVTAP